MNGINTKSQILTAAIELFAKNGYEKTTTRAIADEVGIRAASIYYFFESKESLLEAIFFEFETNFAKYRNKPEMIYKAAGEKPLSEVLCMLYYTFGEPDEHFRMMTISRVILSLLYENAGAKELYEKVVVQDALEYGATVLKGLYSLGVIKKVDFEWTAYIFHAFAVSMFSENLRSLNAFSDSSRHFSEGIEYMSKQFALIMKR